ncbi:hypothetical protein N7478_005701 [Penicillium angulare]|uniref:uncharacterized protein n=1 Tax=Penicillium angulare TaxID=116970 RepID=UPI0025403917|nr:uncharacterized protein N7478_005701 [Penicillium angulare]KAJ5280329.1 hypothetical protein N7478_005701 [Penicillium angulare]
MLVERVEIPVPLLINLAVIGKTTTPGRLLSKTQRTSASTDAITIKRLHSLRFTGIFGRVDSVLPPYSPGYIYLQKPTPDAAGHVFMAGSRRSPVLRDQWSGDPDREPRPRDNNRGRVSHRDRGRYRNRDRGRGSRPNGRRFDYPPRSPPISGRVSRFGPDSSIAPNDPAIDRSPPRGSPGPSPGFYNNRRSDQNRPPSSGDWNSHPSGPLERDGPGFRRDDSPGGPPSKRKRTRSPSPRGPRGQFPPRQPSFAKHGDRRDRSPGYKNRGGRFPGRGGPRRRSPRRGRDRRGRDRGRPDFQRPGRSRSPARGRGNPTSPDRRSRTPSAGGYSDRDSRYRSRSVSRHSGRSAASRISSFSSRIRGDEGINLNRPAQYVADDSALAPSPRPIPSFDDSQVGRLGDEPDIARDAFSIHGSRQPDIRNKQRRPSRSHIDIHPYSKSPHFTPASSHRGSPPTSPRSGGRGGWNGQPAYSGPGQSSPHRNDDYYHSQNIPTGPYSQMHQGFDGPSNHHAQTPHGAAPYRGGLSGYRGNHPPQGPSHRYSGPGSQQYSNGPMHRGGRGHFNNSQWTSRGRGGHQSPRPLHSQGSRTPPSRQQSVNDPQSPEAFENLVNHQSSNNRGSERDDVRGAAAFEGSDGQNDSHDMPPPAHEDEPATPADKGGKFSFALKAKTTPASAPKPKPDLAQRMQIREPTPRAHPPDAPSPRNRLTNGPLPKFKPEPRFDRRDRGRDRRNARNPRDFHDSRDRRDDRRFDQRRDGRRGGRQPDSRQDRRREFSPPPQRESPRQPPKQKKILTRFKPRPTLPEQYASVDSVYYRKPGNESVIGAGTYGKVFKGIHVFTKREVALKKIRMEGEKDGFPVTAVREIKLLQHLRSHNVVSLLEVMVERNECFMVFEYLSHDLTGLINHPGFSLTLAHKKDLAKQMFEGLNFLHHRGVLHRDIKAANILISNQGLLKFADFGLACFFSKTRQLDYTNRVITIWYRPPELLLGETRYGPAVDVWSAACVCMEMFTKKAVFPGDGGEISQLEKLYESLGTPTRAEWADFVEMPWFQLMRPHERKKRIFEDTYRDTLTPAALDMISSVFQYDPTKRPSAEQVLQHPYFLSEEPTPTQATELEFVQGDWHEFESKALRKEARRVEAQNQKDRDKRKAENPSDRDSKRARPV